MGTEAPPRAPSPGSVRRKKVKAGPRNARRTSPGRAATPNHRSAGPLPQLPTRPSTSGVDSPVAGAGRAVLEPPRAPIPPFRPCLMSLAERGTSPDRSSSPERAISPTLTSSRKGLSTPAGEESPVPSRAVSPWRGSRERTAEEMEDFLKRRKKRTLLTESLPIRRLLQHHGLKSVLAHLRTVDDITEAKRDNATRTALRLHHELRVRDIWQAVVEEKRKANNMLAAVKKQAEKAQARMADENWQDRPFSVPPTRVELPVLAPISSTRRGTSKVVQVVEEPKPPSPTPVPSEDVERLLDWVA